MIIQNIIGELDARDVNNRFVQFRWDDEEYVCPITNESSWIQQSFGTFAIRLNADFGDEDGELLGVYNIVPLD